MSTFTLVLIGAILGFLFQEMERRRGWIRGTGILLAVSAVLLIEHWTGMW